MDFVILKINGHDVSQCSHDEAVDAFMKAEEPITVEVLRRSNTDEGKNNESSVSSTSSSLRKMKNQTENNNRNASTNNNLVADDSGNRLMQHHLNHHQTEETLTSEDGGDLILPDLEYEEVILARSSSSEKLGLTLCYETDPMSRSNSSCGNNVPGLLNNEENHSTSSSIDIFIDDIHPEGLAARDGRLRLGDQIIQIDGEEIQSKSQAQEIFLRSKGDISLLVARPPAHYREGNYSSTLGDFYIDEEDELEEEGEENESKLKRSSTESGDSLLARNLDCEDLNSTLSSTAKPPVNHHPGYGSVSSQDSGQHEDENRLNTTKSSSNDSTSSSKNVSSGNSKKDQVEDLEREIYYMDKKLNDIRMDCEAMVQRQSHFQPTTTKQPSAMTRSYHHQQRVLPPQPQEPIYETIPEIYSDAETGNNNNSLYCDPVDSLRRLRFEGESQESKDHRVAARARLTRSVSCHPATAMVAEDDPHRAEKIKEIERWLKSSKLGGDPNCLTSMISPTATTSQQLYQKRNNQNKPLPAVPQRTVSLNPQYQQLPNPPSNKGPSLQLSSGFKTSTLSLVSSSQNNQNNNKKSVMKTPSGKMPLKGTMKRPPVLVQQQLPTSKTTAEIHNHKTAADSNQKQQQTAADIAYTNAENLSITMRMQQEQLLLQSKVNKVNQNGQPQAVQLPESSDPNWEWKVKIRPDGSRYVTRRPKDHDKRRKMRTRAAARLNAERAPAYGTVTTDDDAMSEFKVGKYWPREERKIHLEKAKEERRKRQMALIQKKANLNSTQQIPQQQKRDQEKLDESVQLTVITV